jgi:cell division ATPase FtsA
MATFKTANQFSLHIERLAAEKSMTHVDAILAFCEEHTLDPSDVATKINKSLREKIEQDFRELNYLPKQAQLDL